jgi:hypothetical protein
MSNERETPITDFLDSEVYYDNEGQYFFTKNGQMVCELRGWGRIQNMFKHQKDAEDFQDRLGEFIAKAINDAMHPERIKTPDEQKKMRFAVGDKAKVIGNTSLHEFVVDTVVTITETHPEDETPHYTCTDGRDIWWLSDQDLTPTK